MRTVNPYFDEVSCFKNMIKTVVGFKTHVADSHFFLNFQMLDFVLSRSSNRICQLLQNCGNCPVSSFRVLTLMRQHSHWELQSCSFTITSVPTHLRLHFLYEEDSTVFACIQTRVLRKTLLLVGYQLV